jgi:hypothetical protein
MRFENFQYEGAAILKGANRLIEGSATVSGRLGREVTDPPDHALVDFVSLSGIFKANTAIPADFARLSFNIKNGCKLTLVGEGGIGPALLCTIEQMEGERSIKIIHAGY